MELGDPFISTMSVTLYTAQQTNAGDGNPALTVSSSYTQVRDLHISGGLEIRFPSKATIDSRAYQCETAKISGGVFLAGESDDVANVLQNPAVRSLSLRREGLSNCCPKNSFNRYINVSITKQEVTTTQAVLTWPVTYQLAVPLIEVILHFNFFLFDQLKDYHV
jgi:hypothetical protein